MKLVIAIDARHSSNMLDIRKIRKAKIDSDRYIVVVKHRIRISMVPQQKPGIVGKFDVKRLQVQDTARTFADRVSRHISVDPLLGLNVEGQWIHI